jgi:hypothetical protein
MTSQLCRGRYQASHIPGAILIVASGWHPTSGYEVWFDPERAPYHVALYHKAPEIGGDVLTAFTVGTTVSDPTNAVQIVWVHDASGVHAIKVEPAFDFVACAAEGGDMPFPRHAKGGDGPFPTREALTAERAAIKPGQCGAWYAWIDKMPGSVHRLYVIGTCVFPTSGWKVRLERAVPQGTNPNILILRKVITRPTGIVFPTITNVPVRYEELPSTEYKQVDIQPGGPVITVHIVQ